MATANTWTAGTTSTADLPVADPLEFPVTSTTTDSSSLSLSSSSEMYTSTPTVTSFIPLTSDPSDDFTMPAECSSQYQYNRFPFDIELIAFDPHWGVNINSSQKCLPEAASSWFLSDTYTDPGDGGTVTSLMISPLECPNGWSTAKTSDYSGSGSGSTLAVTCCPSGYIEDYPGQAEGAECWSDLTPGATLTYQSYLTLSNGAPDTESWTAATTNLITHSGVGAVAIKGLALATATSTPTGTGTGDAEASATMEGVRAINEDGGLSVGAKAGIGVGVGVGGLVVLGLGAFLLWRRKKGKGRAKGEETGPTEVIAELETTKGSPQEIDSQAVKPELAADRPIAELDGSVMVHEK